MKLSELMPSIYKLIPYEYDKIKNDEYEQVIENFLLGLASSNNPSIKQISGIPGSGKTVLSKMHKSDNHLFVSFDSIMDRLGGYQKDADDKGLVRAFESWEIPARVVGYELLRRTVEKRVCIVLEHSGVNEAHVELFKKLKELGYKTEVSFTKCDVDLAHARVAEREKVIKRHTPRQLIEERALVMDKYVAVYQQIADAVKVYDTCGNEPVEI